MTSTIAVIGTGYVGLTTGACFAHLGHHVVCADIVAEKVERLQRGEIPIHEAGLQEIVRDGLDRGTLSFVLGGENAVADAEFVYLCVPTPQSADGSADLRYLEAAASQISPHLAPGTVVVNKSTVPVGSTLLVEQALGRSDVPVVSNPEFLREGTAVDDFLKPDRVVIGADDQAAAGRVASLYLGVRAPIMVTDPASAIRPTSFRPKSISMRCSAISLGSLRSSASISSSSSRVRPRLRVPASGRTVTSPSSSLARISGDEDTMAKSSRSMKYM